LNITGPKSASGAKPFDIPSTRSTNSQSPYLLQIKIFYFEGSGCRKKQPLIILLLGASPSEGVNIGFTNDSLSLNFKTKFTR